jgi:hypothetical protein
MPHLKLAAGTAVHPIVRAISDAHRATRHLNTAWWPGHTGTDAEVREALTAALGASLALTVDVRDALRELNARQPGPELTEAEARDLAGGR